MKKLSQKKSNYLTYIVLFLCYGLTMLGLQMGMISRHMQSLLIPICVNMILAVSLNLIIGILGELSLGHAGFMSVGAYAGCLFSIYTADLLPTFVRFPLALLAGGLAASVFGFVVGIPVLRLKGDYLAIVTLAFGEILRSVIINLDFTGGAAGLKGMPQDSTFTAAFLCLVLTYFVITNLAKSQHGRAIRSLKENTIAAQSCGVNVNHYKLMTFVISAFFAGIAGVLAGHNLSILTASNFGYNRSIEILVMVVLGGIGNLQGSMFAAFLLAVLPESLKFLSDYRMLIYSVLLIAMTILGASDEWKVFKESVLNTLLRRNKNKEVCTDGKA